MDVAEIFELESRLDPAHAGPEAQRLLERMRAAGDGDDELLGRLTEAGSCLWDSAQLVAYTLAEPQLDGDVTEDHAHWVHRLALLSRALHRHPDAVVDPGDSATGHLAEDLKSMGLAARGKLDGPAPGPLSRFIAELRGALESCAGWEAGGAAFSDGLANLVEDLAQMHRLRVVERDDTLMPGVAVASQGTHLGLLVQAAAIVSGDTNRRVRPQPTALAERLSTGVIGFAADLVVHLSADDPERAIELVTQRFALPSRVVRLDRQQLERSLRAVLELELRDLAGAVRYLDVSQPLPGIIKRAVAGTMALDRGTAALIASTGTAVPDRSEVMAQMRAVAKEDGRITADERALLRGMDAHLFDFQTLLDRVVEDAVVDFEEFQQLRSTRHRILDDLFRISLADNKITGEERQLLVRAMELLPSLG